MVKSIKAGEISVLEKTHQDMKTKEKEIIRLKELCFDYFTNYNYWGAVAERKMDHLKYCETKKRTVTDEQVDGVKKSFKELYWETTKIRRQVFNFRLNFEANLAELRKLGITLEDMTKFFAERNVTVKFE